MGFKTETYIIKGMKQDLSDAVFDKSFAFENMNIRIFARQNNSSFSVEQEMGNTKIENIKLYDNLEYTILNSTITDLPFTTIGYCVIDKYIILFGKGAHEDIIARLENINNNWNMVYLYKGSLLGFDVNNPIESLPNIETDSIKKVYFIDGIHQPRAINVLKQYDPDDLGDIALGSHLQLNENFTVTKDWSHSGQYPGGKIQFGFTYLNANGSETNLVEMSPLFDCTMTNNGISNNSAASSAGDYTYSDHSFIVNIDNLDTQFDFIRVYLFLTTSPGTTVIKYIERHLANHDNFSEVIDFNEADLTDYTGSFSDILSLESNIVPYTMATKDNFMFYGNIKESFPDLRNIVFDENDFTTEFDLKEIGREEYLGNTMYHYTPRLTSYNGSNFEYMGFRKYNWYRFGIIAQHESGRWSNVLFLCDRQCTMSSHTEVVYSEDHVPLRSVYYMPKLKLAFTASGKAKLASLRVLGFKKVKPVCVVPPVKYRNIISQGIVTPTMYRGGDRLGTNLAVNNFCFPSYFFRPKPLSSPLNIDSSTGVVSPAYSYTLRSVKDLSNSTNFSDGSDIYLTNPTFTRSSDVVTMNSPYREYRHGFSLPPKDTINAECEFSALSLNDFCYLDNNGNIANYFSNINFEDFNTNGCSVNWPIRNAPDKIWVNNYSNTVFIDESVCTFNSPEVDLNDMFVSGVRNLLSNADVRISGYAQITGGGNRIRVASTYPKGDYVEYAKGFMPQTYCLFSMDDNDDLDFIYDMVGRRNGNKQQPLPYFSGPFYFTPIKTLGLIGKNNKYDSAGYNDGVYEDGFSSGSWAGDIRHFSKTFYQYNGLLKFDWSFYGELKNRGNLTFNVSYNTPTPGGNTVTRLSINNSGILSSDNVNVSVSDFYSQKGLNTNVLDTSVIRLVLQANGITNFNRDTNRSDHNFVLRSNTQLLFPDDFVLNSATNQWLSDGPSSFWLYITDDFVSFTWNGQNVHTHNMDSSNDASEGNYFFYPFIAKRLLYSPVDPIITMPMLLPIKDSSMWFSDFFKEHPNNYPIDMVNGAYAIYCMAPSEYGGHYYSAFSTNFMHSVFEPWYLCAIYPFMHTNSEVSLIGTTKVYSEENPQMYGRPSYNNTSTLLYSTVTNYFDEITFNPTSRTTQGYYSQNEQIGCNFSNLGWLSSSNGNITLRYDYKINSLESPLYFNYKTTPLIAAMKWYRGFKSLKSSNPEQLISNGVVLSYESFGGNVAFSGLRPQLFTKCGYIPTKYFMGIGSPASSIAKRDIQDVTNMYDDFEDNLTESSRLISNFDIQTYPHIVFTSAGRMISVLPEFTYDPLADERTQPINELDYSVNVNFKSNLYYKHFVHPSDFEGLDYNYLDFLVQSNPYAGAARGAYTSIYPHTGYWAAYNTITHHNYNGENYWQRNYNDNHPNSHLINLPYIQRQKINLGNRIGKHLMGYDENGNLRNIDNFWLLQIADLYNAQLEYEYSNSTLGNNPYTYEGIRADYWVWMPCGYSCRIDELTDPLVNNRLLSFEEGDTYFQRYNSIKSYKRPLSANFKNDISDVASVMIETYINLDGHYWDHTELRSYESNVLLMPEADTQSKINPVYTLDDGYMTSYYVMDYNYPREKRYPTRIMWTVKKLNGELTDSWGVVPASNYYDTLGTCGDISKLVSYNDNVYCLQQHGFSVLDFNSKSLISSSTGNPISIYFQEGLRLQNNTYFSRDVGTLNKWSVVVGRGGIYWMDETLKSFYKFPGNESNVPVDLSLSASFKAWSNNNIFENDSVWDVKKFNPGSHSKSYKANYDIKHNDVYWGNANHCICFNELVDSFTSFFSYERVPYIFNYKDEVYSIFQDINTSKLYNQFSNYQHQLYGASMSSYIELLVNPEPLYDKVFNFIEYDAECFDINSPNRESLLQRIPNLNPYNKISVHNSFQDGSYMMDSRNTSQRFRVWRTDLPREQGTMNRIRSPWCRIKLENELSDAIRIRNYRDQLHYISVNYTIPDQPLKTNLR